MSENVAILGASTNPERYAYKAYKLLTEYGHNVFLVSPRYPEIDGHKTFGALSDLDQPIDTVTVYVGPKISSGLTTEIAELKPGRVIFNPGAENAELAAKLKKAGIKVEEACTLVLLRTGQF